MEFDFVEWDAEDDPRGNVRHIADNGLSVDEVEDVIYDPQSRQVQSRSSKAPGSDRSSRQRESHYRDL